MPLATPVAISTTLPPAITAMQQQGIAVFALPATPSQPQPQVLLLRARAPGRGAVPRVTTAAASTAALVEGVVHRQHTSQPQLLPTTLDLTDPHGTDGCYNPV